LDEVFRVREQQYAGIVVLTKRKFRQTKQVVPPFCVLDISFVAVAAAPTLPDSHGYHGLDVADVWQAPTGRICQRFPNELREVGVGNERAGRVENQDDSMLTRPLRLDEFVEII